MAPTGGAGDTLIIADSLLVGFRVDVVVGVAVAVTLLIDVVVRTRGVVSGVSRGDSMRILVAVWAHMGALNPERLPSTRVPQAHSG